MYIVFLLHLKLDRRTSLDRLRQASVASSNSDLANSISPPAVRFTIDATNVSPNPFSILASARRTSNFSLIILYQY